MGAIPLGFVFFGWGLCLAYGSAILSHQLEKRYSVPTLLRVSLFVFAIFLFALFLIDAIWLKVVLIILSGLASGLNNALFTSHVMSVSPYERGVTSGAYNFVRWLGGAIAPLLSGVIGHAIAPQAPFLVGGIVVVVAGIIMSWRVAIPQHVKQ